MKANPKMDLEYEDIIVGKDFTYPDINVVSKCVLGVEKFGPIGYKFRMVGEKDDRTKDRYVHIDDVEIIK